MVTDFFFNSCTQTSNGLLVLPSYSLKCSSLIHSPVFQSDSFKLPSLSSNQNLLPQIYSQPMTCLIFYWQSWSHRKEFPHVPLYLDLSIYIAFHFLIVAELSMLLYKANDSTWALNPVPSLPLNDIASIISFSLCITMKLSFFTAHSHHHAIIGSLLYCKTPWKILSLFIIFTWYTPSVIEFLEITLSTLPKQILSKSLMTFKLPHKKKILFLIGHNFLTTFGTIDPVFLREIYFFLGCWKNVLFFFFFCCCLVFFFAISLPGCS